MISSSPAGLDSPPRQIGLKRQVGLPGATAMVMGEAIAVGIFLTPAAMARSLATPLWLLIVWLFMGAMAVSGALCYGELASRFPAAGGGYVYLREAYGERLAFLYGWMSLLVVDPGITAALGVGLAAYVGFIVPLSALGLKLVALATILALAAVNIRRTTFGAGLLETVTWLKFGLLVLLVGWALARKLGDWSHFSPFATRPVWAPPLRGALASSFLAAFFSFGGWWDVSKLAGEVRDPQRTLRRALVLGVVAVTVVYILVSGTFLYLVPVRGITSDETFVAQAGQRLFGMAGGKVLSGLVVACVLGSMAAMIMASPRVYYAMARDGLFFSGIAEVHPRFGTPARAIALQAVLASVLVLLGNFTEIIACFIFPAVFFIGLTVAGLFRLPPLASAVRVPRMIPLFFLTLVVCLMALLAVKNPRQSLLGLIVVSLGTPAYELFKRGRRSRASHACTPSIKVDPQA